MWSAARGSLGVKWHHKVGQFRGLHGATWRFLGVFWGKFSKVIHRLPKKEAEAGKSVVFMSKKCCFYAEVPEKVKFQRMYGTCVFSVLRVLSDV